MRGTFNSDVFQLVGQAPSGQSRAIFDFNGDHRDT